MEGFQGILMFESLSSGEKPKVSGEDTVNLEVDSVLLIFHSDFRALLFFFFWQMSRLSFSGTQCLLVEHGSTPYFDCIYPR